MELAAAAAAEPPASGQLEIVLGDGRAVRVPAGFYETTLKRLMAVLESR